MSALVIAIAWVVLARRRRRQRALSRRYSHRHSVQSRGGGGGESTTSLYTGESGRAPLDDDPEYNEHELEAEAEQEMAERERDDGHEYVAASVHSPTTPTTPFSPTAWTGLMAGAGSMEGREAAGSSETGWSSSAQDRTGRSSSSLSTLQPVLGGMTFTQAAAAMASNGNGESSRSGNGRTSAGSTSHTDENGQGSSSGSRSGGVAIPEPAVVAPGPSRSEGELVPTPFPYTYQPRRHGSTSPYESREPTGTGYVQLDGWSGESSRGIVGRGFRSLLGRVRIGRRTSAPPVMEGRRLPALTIQVPPSGPGPGSGSGLPVILVDGEPEEESEGMGEGLLTPGIESSTSLRDDWDYSRPIGGVGAHVGFIRIWVLTLTCRQCIIQATAQVDRHSPKGTVMDNNLMDYLLLALLSYIGTKSPSH